MSSFVSCWIKSKADGAKGKASSLKCAGFAPVRPVEGRFSVEKVTGAEKGEAARKRASVALKGKMLHGLYNSLGIRPEINPFNLFGIMSDNKPAKVSGNPGQPQSRYGGSSQVVKA